MKVLEAIDLLKANPANTSLANAIADSFDDYLDVLEDINPADEKEADILDDKIDAVSELADVMLAYKEECKAYTKALKTNHEADYSKLEDIIFDLYGYLNEYAEKYSGLDNFQVNIE